MGETTVQTVREMGERLRGFGPRPLARRHATWEAFWGLWRSRLRSGSGWKPPAGSTFPWEQVRGGLRALQRTARRCFIMEEVVPTGVLGLVLAGNTPLLAWPALSLATLLGVPVLVKVSSDDSFWVRLFWEALAEVDPEAAERLYLIAAPGDDPRTTALLESVTAVIAYGSDEAIAALRAKTPEATPFLGFGHALSVAVSRGVDRWLIQDVLLYDQAGCLSPQAVFVERVPTAMPMGTWEKTLHELAVPPRTDLVACARVRAIRDLAQMEGAQVWGDAGLRWTVIAYPEPRPVPPPTGFGVLHLIPLPELTALGDWLGATAGHLSCVGIGGELPYAVWAAARATGVSRVCRTGEMQCPPLDWPNAGVDLAGWLRKNLSA